MNGPTDPDAPRGPDGWERIAEELQACQQTQRRAWGDVDSADLGRYLAGQADAGEAARIESALGELPELRKLTDVVRGVLDDLGPVSWDDTPLDVPAPIAEAPVLLPFRPRAAPPKRATVGPWLRRRAPLVAAACLMLVVGAALPGLAPLAGSRPGPELADGQAVRLGPPEAGPGDRALPAMPLLPGPVAALALNEEPQQANFPGLPTKVFDATKRSFHLQHKDGDLRLAAREAETAVAHCQQKNFRVDHPARANAVRRLADVYQAALNCQPTADKAVRVPLKYDRTKGGGKAAGTAASPHRTAQLLLEDINKKPVGEVRTTIVPVLAEALLATSEMKDRVRLVQALGRLGPAAGPAVPVLTRVLKETTDRGEAREVIAVLTEMGPVGKDAWREMARYVGYSSPAPPPPGAAKSAVLLMVSPARAEMAKTFSRVPGSMARVGVLDKAGCFSLRAASEATARLRGIARDHNVEVLIETVSGSDVDGRWPPPDKLAPRALHVRIALRSALVQVRAGDEIKGLLTAAGRARDRAADCCKRSDHDAALRELVTTLALAKPR